MKIQYLLNTYFLQFIVTSGCRVQLSENLDLYDVITRSGVFLEVYFTFSFFLFQSKEQLRPKPPRIPENTYMARRFSDISSRRNLP